MNTLAYSEDPDKMQHMLHFIRVYTVCKEKIDFRQNNTLIKNYNLKPLDMYNGLSQAYSITLSHQKEKSNSIQRVNR